MKLSKDKSELDLGMKMQEDIFEREMLDIERHMATLRNEDDTLAAGTKNAKAMESDLVDETKELLGSVEKAIKVVSEEGWRSESYLKKGMRLIEIIICIG